MDFADRLSTMIKHDMLRMAALEMVRDFGPAGGWIAAGFVRDAVWDQLHERPIAPPAGDVDVIWFDRQQMDEECDRDNEKVLRRRCPDLRWSVKNQARMHLRSGERRYESVADAMRFWPETATAVAVRLTDCGELEIAAPFGLDDLFAPRLVATPSFIGEKRHIFEQRIARKRWLARYPLLSGRRI